MVLERSTRQETRPLSVPLQSNDTSTSLKLVSISQTTRKAVKTTRKGIKPSFGFDDEENQGYEPMIRLLSAILLEAKKDTTMNPVAKRMLRTAIEKDMRTYMLRKELQDMENGPKKDTATVILKKVMHKYIELIYILSYLHNVNYYSERRGLAAKVSSEEERTSVSKILPEMSSEEIAEMADNAGIITLDVEWRDYKKHI